MITKDVLDTLFTYCPKTGNMYWKTSRKWTTIKAGDVAGSVDKRSKYRRLRIPEGRIDCHRAIWIMVYGEIPTGMVIDHIDHDRGNNKLDNLRVTTNRGNGTNLKLNPLNKSGATGVCWDKSREKWAVHIRTGGGKKKTVGRFSSFEEAVEARMVANRVYGYHKNHGRSDEK